MSTLDQQLSVFLIVGEPSGDLLGARLIESLNRISEQPISYSGVGGPLMQSVGFKSLFDYRDLAVMGFLEVLPHIYKLLKKINLVKEKIENINPDVIISIDSPGFCFRVLKNLSTHDKPRIHYVAPQIWAWRENRVYKYKKYIDHVLALFPFEPPYFNKNWKNSWRGLAWAPHISSVSIDENLYRTKSSKDLLMTDNPLYLLGRYFY